MTASDRLALLAVRVERQFEELHDLVSGKRVLEVSLESLSEIAGLLDDLLNGIGALGIVQREAESKPGESDKPKISGLKCWSGKILVSDLVESLPVAVCASSAGRAEVLLKQTTKYGRVEHVIDVAEATMDHSIDQEMIVSVGGAWTEEYLGWVKWHRARSQASKS